MREFIQKPRSTGSNRDDELYDNGGGMHEFDPVARRHQQVQQDADATIGGIDDLLNNQEQQAAQDTAAGATANTAGANREDLAASESAPQGADNSSGTTEESDDKSESGRKRGLRGWLKSGRNKAIAGGITGILIGGGFFVSLPAIQAAQVIHAGQILSRTAGKGEEDSQERSAGLFRWLRAARKGNIGETRVGLVGSKVFGTTIDQLKAIGVEIKYNGFGHPTEIAFDRNKLAAQHPRVANMNNAEFKNYLAERMPEIRVTDLHGSGNVVTADAKKISLQAARLNVKSAVGLLDNGKIVTGMKWRILARYFKLPSLFHPLKKLDAKIERTIVGAAVTRAERKKEAERKQALREPSKATAAQARENIKSQDKVWNNAAAKFLLFTGTACFVLYVADDVVTTNHALIVTPSAVAAADIMGVMSQMQSGEDLTAQQVAAVGKSFEGEDGKTIWDGKAMKALSTDNADTSGEDIPDSYKQAFSGEMTANKIRDAVNDAINGDFTCSPAGIILQAAAGVLLAFGSLITEVGTAGLATPGVIALYTAKFGLSAAISYTVYAVAQHFIVEATSEDPLPEGAFGGILGGGLLPLGAREAANIAARSSGGIALGNNTSTLYVDAIEAREQEEFKSRSTFARIFDIKDYRSVSGKLAAKVDPNLQQNMASALMQVVNIKSLFGNMFAAFVPQVRAADEPYDWGFPQYGIPESMLNDPELEDPYENARQAVEILKGTSAETYTDKALDCFGVVILQDADGVWDVKQEDEAPIPSSSAYENARCDDISDKNWQRIIMFVMDTNTMKAVGCFEGEDELCSELAGQDPTAGAPSSPTPGIDPNATYVNPLQGSSYRCTSGFGPRWGTKHEGVDMALPVGNRVLAPTAGTIKRAGASSGYGLVVVILGDDGFHYELGHISSVSVKVGDKVAAGAEVAKSGNTGQSTGPHLHFSVATGYFTGRIDPETHMASRGVTLCP